MDEISLESESISQESLKSEESQPQEEGNLEITMTGDKILLQKYRWSKCLFIFWKTDRDCSKVSKIGSFLKAYFCTGVEGWAHNQNLGEMVGENIEWVLIYDIGPSKTNITSMTFDENTKFLATGALNGGISVFNLYYGHADTKIETPDESETVLPDGKVRYPVTWLRWKPNYGGYGSQSHILAASYGNNVIKIWDTSRVRDPQKKITEDGNTGVYSIDFSTTGSVLASGGADATVRLYDTSNYKLIHEYTPGFGSKVDHFNRIHWVKYNPEDENVIYSWGDDKKVSIHDTRVKDPIGSILGPYVIGDALDVQSTKLLTGSYRTDDWLEIWDIRNFEKVSTFQWDPDTDKECGQVIAARFTRGSTFGVIAAGRSQNNVKIFDRRDGEILAKISGFEEMNYSLDLSHEGNLIGIGNKDGSTLLYEYE